MALLSTSIGGLTGHFDSEARGVKNAPIAYGMAPVERRRNEDWPGRPSIATGRGDPAGELQGQRGLTMAVQSGRRHVRSLRHRQWGVRVGQCARSGGSLRCASGVAASALVIRLALLRARAMLATEATDVGLGAAAPLVFATLVLHRSDLARSRRASGPRQSPLSNTYARDRRIENSGFCSTQRSACSAPCKAVSIPFRNFGRNAARRGPISTPLGNRVLRTHATTAPSRRRHTDEN